MTVLYPVGYKVHTNKEGDRGHHGMTVLQVIRCILTKKNTEDTKL